MPLPPALENANTAGAALMACPECDLLVRAVPLADGSHGALCPRCRAFLYQDGTGGLERALALACAALVLFAVANAFPLIGLDIKGQRVDTTVFGAVRQLWREDMPAGALLVLATTIVTPLLELGAILWLTLPLHLGRRPPGFALVFRALHLAEPWAMLEVFFLGMLVSLVKLSHLAGVIPGPALWCFGALMLVMAALSAALDPRRLWRVWEEAPA